MDGSPGAGRLRRFDDRKVLLILTIITMLGLAAALRSAWGSYPLRSDSPSYLYFDPSRSVGYPAFLWLVRLITGQVGLAVPVQMTLLAGSLLAVGWSFHRFGQRTILSVLFQVLLIASPEMWKISALIMTEALATACVALWCAQMLRMLKAPSLGGTGVLVAIAVVGTIVRPPLAALFIATVAFEFAAGAKAERGRALAMVGAGLIAAWIATPAAFYFIHGSAATTSPLARGILQHSLFCQPRTTSQDPDSMLVEQYAAPVRRYVASAPADLAPVLRRIYSGELRYGLIIPALGNRHYLDSEWQTDAIIARVAAERVRANPLCYAASVISAEARMATYGTSGAPGAPARLRQFIAMHPPVPVPTAPILPDDRRDSVRAAMEFHGSPPFPVPPAAPFQLNDKSPFLVVVAARLLFGGAAVFGLLALLAILINPKLARKSWNTLAGAAAAGVAFHGTIAITAIVELGLTRYTVPVWPIVCTLVGMGTLLGLNARPDRAN